MLTETIADTTPLQDALFAKLEDSATLTRALTALAPQHREILLLYYTNDLTFEEIGAMQGENPNTVKSRHRRALAALRATIESTNMSASNV